MQATAGLRERMKIFGTDYDTPDGTYLRDYIPVNDIASAHMLSEQAFDMGLTKAEVNIGTGKAISNLNILRTVENVTQRAVPYEKAPRRQGDVSHLYADSSRAKQVLGFEPKYPI